LLAFVDDATSRLMLLRFVASESAFSYFTATRAYLEAHGKPVAFYSDKHGVFRVNSRGGTGDEVTQFGRALCELNIDIICANSPQAKGRVERAFGTLQDRLVKELRLAGITGVAAGNAWLPGFVADYNRRFGRLPANGKDLHRAVSSEDDLDEALCWREVRTVTANLVLHYDRIMLLLDPTPVARGLVRKTVEVVNYPDGRFAVRHAGMDLPFQVFDKGRQVQQGSVVANKNLGTAMTVIKAKQARRGNMIAGSLAALAPAAEAQLPDRLGPVLAYAQTLQGQAGKKPHNATRRPSAAPASSDISIGEKS